MKRLREAHAHIVQHGRELDQLNLAECRTRAECLDRIAAEASRGGEDSGWFIANGARVESWTDGAWPTIQELDRACPSRPCMVQSFDHHACVVNSAAFAAAGFDDASIDPPNGRIERDRLGRPTGLLIESAYGKARSSIPLPPPEQLRRIIKLAVEDLAKHGFIEVHDLLSQPWLGPVLADLDAKGELPVSVWLYPILEEFEATAAGAARWQSARVKLAGAKVFADGTLNSRTAWMLHTYADPLPGLPRGQQMKSVEQLREAMATTARHGLGLAVHAIGDAAVRDVLDAFSSQPRRAERTNAWVRAANADVPSLRIEHAELVDEKDVPRFAELGVVCSVQPCHLLYDIEALARGQPRRLDRVLPLRDLIHSGCRPGELMWFGSDTPIVRPHPADSIRAAVHRGREDSRVVIAGDQAITEREAWMAFGT